MIFVYNRIANPLSVCLYSFHVIDHMIPHIVSYAFLEMCILLGYRNIGELFTSDRSVSWSLYIWHTKSFYIQVKQSYVHLYRFFVFYQLYFMYWFNYISCLYVCHVVFFAQRSDTGYQQGDLPDFSNRVYRCTAG